MSTKTFKAAGITFKADTKKETLVVTIGKARTEMNIIDLWGIVFSMVNSDLKDKIMPVRKEEVMKFKKVHTVQLIKDMKKGETITFSCIIDVPVAVKEGLENLVGDDKLSTLTKIDTPLIEGVK